VDVDVDDKGGWWFRSTVVSFFPHFH